VRGKTAKPAHRLYQFCTFKPDIGRIVLIKRIVFSVSYVESIRGADAIPTRVSNSHAGVEGLQ
jgi:hypothetical protein